MNRLYVLLRRLSTILLGASLLSIAVAIFFKTFGWLPIELSDLGGFKISVDPTTLSTSHQLMWTVWAILGVATGGTLIWIGVKYTKSVQRFTISRPRHGRAFGDVSVSVAVKGVHSLVAHLAENVDQVRECDPQVSLNANGWKVNCHIYVAPSAALPQVADALRRSIRQSLEHHTGLPVAKLEIETELFPLGGK